MKLISVMKLTFEYKRVETFEAEMIRNCFYICSEELRSWICKNFQKNCIIFCLVRYKNIENTVFFFMSITFIKV